MPFDDPLILTGLYLVAWGLIRASTVLRTSDLKKLFIGHIIIEFRDTNPREGSNGVIYNFLGYLWAVVVIGIMITLPISLSLIAFEITGTTSPLNLQSLFNPPDGPMPPWSALAITVVLTVVATMILHEIGHLLSYRAEGVPIHSTGMLLICGIPTLMFVRVEERHQQALDAGSQLRVATAGIAMNVTVAFCAIGLLFAGGFRSYVLYWIWVIETSFIVFSCLPFGILDGKTILHTFMRVIINSDNPSGKDGRIGPLIRLFQASVAVPILFIVTGFALL